MKLLLFLAAVTAAAQTTKYEIDLSNAVHHEARVKATFTGVKAKSLEILMSRASPGRYAAHDFAKNVYEIRTTDGHGKEIRRDQADNNRWIVSGHDGTVVFEYTLFGDRVDGTYVGIDRTHAHLNMPGTVAWARGLESRPIMIRFTPPQGEQWTVATQLDERPDNWWYAPNLDYLMDSPTDVGPHQFSEWMVGDAKFRMALHHKGTPESTGGFLEKARAITAEEEGVFGNFPHYDYGRYTFVADYLPYANGDGMEHRNSTSITAGASIEQSGDRLLGTLAHEFFHSWNMERIRSKGIEPFQYDRPNMSGELWFGEGFTNYYEYLAMHRAGVIDFNAFLDSMTSFVNTVTASPGRLMHSAMEMSRLAPYVDAATSIDKTNRENTFISYYTYGAALGLGIDLKIRKEFPGKSLDDWMRAMWKEHPDVAKPYTLDSLRAALASVTSPSFSAEIFSKHIEGKELMPYDALLASAGLSLVPRMGRQTWLGGTFNATPNGIELTAPSLRGGPLYNAGIESGDVLLMSDGVKLDSLEALNKILDEHHPGDKISLTVNTRAGRKEITTTLAAPPFVRIARYEDLGREVTPEIKSFRESWTSSKALHKAIPH